MLLNVGPDDRGRIPAGAQQSLRGVGDWLRSNGKAVYGTSMTGLVADPGWGAVTRRGDKLYLSVHDWASSLHLSTKALFDVLGARVLGSGHRVRTGRLVLGQPSVHRRAGGDANRSDAELPVA